MNRRDRLIRMALASPRDRARLAEEGQRDETEQANAVRAHQASVRAERTGRSPVRRRWGSPP